MTKTFDLLSLPLELRREIYHHCFVPIENPYGSSYRRIEADTYCKIYYLNTCRTSILTVNRQVYLEARDVLYRDTTWHITLDCLNDWPNPDIFGDFSLRAFRSRPEFQFIRDVTIGVMINTYTNTTTLTPEDSQRLHSNRKLLDLVCETLLLAPELLTLRLIWHDRIEHGVLEKKLDCLQALAKIPETVKCAVFLGSEAMTVHFPHRYSKEFKARWRKLAQESPRQLSTQEEEAKADLNHHLKTVRQQCQARPRREPLDGLGDAKFPSKSIKAGKPSPHISLERKRKENRT